MAIKKEYALAQAENLLAILAHDDKHGKIVANLIEPELFTGDLREVAERLKAYWTKYSKAPKLHTADLFSDIIEDKSNRRAASFKTIIRNLHNLHEGLNTKYVLDMLRQHARVAHIFDAILKSAETLNAKEALGIEEVEVILSDLLSARTYEFDPGLTLRDVDKVVDFLETHYSEFRMGIEPFDRRNIVPARQAVMLFLAPTGFGKTWALCHIGKQALLQRKKVLHISLEMSGEEVMQRYYMNLFSLSKRVAETEVSAFEYDDKGRFHHVGAIETIEPSFSFADEDVRSKLKKHLTKWDKQVKVNSLLDRLHVARFAPGSLSVAGLRAYLDALEATGFLPDMVVLDYIGIMKTDEKNQRVSLGRVMQDFRAVMVDRNIAGVTAHQVSKVGAAALTVKPIHVAEDWSLIGTTDVALTMSQTPAEHKLGLARLLVAKSRSEADKFGVIITQSYDLGQFALQAAFANAPYWKFVKGLPKPDGEDDDEEEAAEE